MEHWLQRIAISYYDHLDKQNQILKSGCIFFLLFKRYHCISRPESFSPVVFYHNEKFV